MHSLHELSVQRVTCPSSNVDPKDAEARWHNALQLCDSTGDVVTRFIATELPASDVFSKSCWRVDGLIGFPSAAAAQRCVIRCLPACMIANYSPMCSAFTMQPSAIPEEQWSFRLLKSTFEVHELLVVPMGAYAQRLSYLVAAYRTVPSQKRASVSC